MAHLPRVVESEVVTKTILREELDRLEHKLDAKLHRALRGQLLAYTTIMAVLNGITFVAIRFAG